MRISDWSSDVCSSDLLGKKRSGRRRTQEERSAETRESLVAAAIEVLAEVGYVAATTAAIAERASVSRGAIQYHFESKNDLVVAIMEAIAVELNFRFDVAELAKHPVEIRLDRMIEHYWRVFQDRKSKRLHSSH